MRKLLIIMMLVPLMANATGSHKHKRKPKPEPPAHTTSESWSKSDADSKSKSSSKSVAKGGNASNKTNNNNNNVSSATSGNSTASNDIIIDDDTLTYDYSTGDDYDFPASTAASVVAGTCQSGASIQGMKAGGAFVAMNKFCQQLILADASTADFNAIDCGETSLLKGSAEANFLIGGSLQACMNRKQVAWDRRQCHLRNVARLGQRWTWLRQMEMCVE